MKYGLTDFDVERIQQILSEFSAIDAAILYGSRAMGRERPGSDIDLVLEGDNLDHQLLLKLRHKLDETTLPYLFDISIRSQIENRSLLEHIERVGKVFFKRS